MSVTIMIDEVPSKGSSQGALLHRCNQDVPILIMGAAELSPVYPRE